MRTRNMCTNGEVGLTFFFLFSHYSHVTYGDHGKNIYSPFSYPLSAQWWLVASTPLPSALDCPTKKKKKVDMPKEITKGKKQRKSVPRPPTPCLSTP